MLGKLGDWRIPMGPYTPPQLAVASIGAFVLIKTASWWAPVVGPVPVVAWGIGIWAARHSRIAGRSPAAALADALSLAGSPKRGRIRGRAVRSMRPSVMTGGFGIQEADDVPPPAPDDAIATGPAAPRTTPQPTPAPPAKRRPAPASRPPGQQARPEVRGPARPGPAMTPLQQMLAAAAARSDTASTTSSGEDRP
ncbi:hypothetical protein LN042_23210 [Kitasatospora sp. RB6PN24]|uniref:hypothetical protein n=1 Tax=Kitasatospora humi TaxID=2893891 RepID=UPI001E37A1FD|nr:hypothetical protein [Kitasatospora humi]MCC9309946.1 hypothetical protein [Kitasatospora humi]